MWLSFLSFLNVNKSDKNKLVICEEEAKIVRIIFEMAYLGKSAGAIKNYLNDNNITTAHRLRYNEFTYWSNKAIKRILTNPVYKGVTIQNKRSRISYKNRKLRPNPEEQWYIVENTHEPIVETSKFDSIQKMQIAQNYTRAEKKNFFLLDGLMICYECKHKIGIKKDRNNRGMICSYYRRFSKLKVCTAHGFNYTKFENTILSYLRNLFKEIDEGKIELNMKNSKSVVDYSVLQDKVKKDIFVINGNIDKMYMDKLENKITEAMYERLYNKLQDDIKQKEKEYMELEELKNDVAGSNDEDIKKLIKEYLSLEKPTPELMKLLINRIEVHQNKEIDIYFNFSKLNKLEKNYKITNKN